MISRRILSERWRTPDGTKEAISIQIPFIALLNTGGGSPTGSEDRGSFTRSAYLPGFVANAPDIDSS